MKESILVIGANGQIGSVLVPKLQNIYGLNNIISTSLENSGINDGIYKILDATDIIRLYEIVAKYKITQIYHLAAILSAKGEENPIRTWNTNMSTLLNVLEVSRINNVAKVFFPSSIAVFGNLAEKKNTPQTTFLNPDTVYGISKATGENWVQYYVLKYGLDVRSLRYPGIVSYQSPPGGGTTDYAVDIYHKAVLHKPYKCFLKSDTMLPMMYIDDALRGTIEYMEAPKEALKTKTAYNLAAISYTPNDVATSIRKHIPSFKIYFEPDERQLIANNWPKIINDMEAKEDWGWNCKYNLELITKTMLENLEKIYSQNNLSMAAS